MRARIKSIGYAINGVKLFLIGQHNAWLHLVATGTVIILAFVYRVSFLEAAALAFAIGMVWVAEIINTAIEMIMDFISMDKHPVIKIIKDVSAGAVLVAAIISLIIGCIVFIPKFIG